MTFRICPDQNIHLREKREKFFWKSYMKDLFSKEFCSELYYLYYFIIYIKDNF